MDVESNGDALVGTSTEKNATVKLEADSCTRDSNGSDEVVDGNEDESMDVFGECGEDDDRTGEMTLGLDSESRLYNLGFKRGLDEEYVEDSKHYTEGYNKGLVEGFKKAFRIGEILGRVRIDRSLPVHAVEELYNLVKAGSFEAAENVLKKFEDNIEYT